MNLGAPELVPGVLVDDLRIEKKDRVILEYCHRGDAALLDLGDQLRPHVVVKVLILAQLAGLQAHRESTAYHGTCLLVGVGWTSRAAARIPTPPARFRRC